MSGGNFRSNQPLRSEGAPPAVRKRVLARDGYLCQLGYAGCTTDAVEVDHIVPVSEHGTNRMDNLQAVCKECHKIKTQTEAQRARAKFSRKRAPQRHPGLLW